MTRKVFASLLTGAALIFSGPAQADTFATVSSIGLVMIGNSSTGTDQLWFSASGQPANVPADCMSGANAFFYIPNDGNISPDHAEAMLLTAKTTGLPLQIVFSVQSTAADMYIFGTTKCTIVRMAVGS